MWQETMGFWDGSGISWTICKQSAPRTRHITTSTPHHSIFYRPDALPDAQPTVSKHIKSTYKFVNTWVNPTVLKTTSRTILLHLFNGLFSRTTWVSRYQKGKTSLNLHEATEDGVLGSIGISWSICKQPAPRSNSSSLNIYRPNVLPDAQATVLKHWR